MRAARDERDVVPASRQLRAEIPTDASTAEYRDPHVSAPSRQAAT
jgi:hypothetical protein